MSLSLTKEITKHICHLARTTSKDTSEIFQIINNTPSCVIPKSSEPEIVRSREILPEKSYVLGFILSKANTKNGKFILKVRPSKLNTLKYIKELFSIKYAITEVKNTGGKYSNFQLVVPTTKLYYLTMRICFDDLLRGKRRYPNLEMSRWSSFYLGILDANTYDANSGLIRVSSKSKHIKTSIINFLGSELEVDKETDTTFYSPNILPLMKTLQEESGIVNAVRPSH